MFWRRGERRQAAAAESIADLIREARGGGSPEPEPVAPTTDADGNLILRRRYRYVGEVQGVGFRWTSQDQLGAFATRLAETLARYARYTVADRVDEPPVASETDFRVRY